MTKHDMPDAVAGAVLTAVYSAAIIVLAMAAFMHTSYGRDNGQWEATTPEIREWYKTLMQPDVPQVSCCGEADAYYADEILVEDGRTYAIVTDTRDDGPLARPHVEPGTKVWIPDHKLKYDRGNPTGHNVIFMNTSLQVHCFVQTTGI